MSVARVEILYTDEQRFEDVVTAHMVEIEREVLRLLNLGSQKNTLYERVIMLPIPLHPKTRMHARSCGNIEIFITIGYCHCGEKIFIDSFTEKLSSLLPFEVAITLYRSGNCWVSTSTPL